MLEIAFSQNCRYKDCKAYYMTDDRDNKIIIVIDKLGLRKNASIKSIIRELNKVFLRELLCQTTYNHHLDEYISCYWDNVPCQFVEVVRNIDIML